MQSWDLIKLGSDRVLIATLIASPLVVTIDWAFNFSSLKRPPDCTQIRVSNMPYGEARTSAAHICLNNNYQWLFFLDSDILCPEDTLLKLMSYRLPIVSALYYQKFPTLSITEVKYMPCMFNETVDDKGNLSRVEIPFQFGQIVEATFVPMGCALIHRSVFEAFLRAGEKKFFQWTLNADNPGGFSEDFFFTKAAKSIGIKSYVDTSIQVYHEVWARIGAGSVVTRV